MCVCMHVRMYMHTHIHRHTIRLHQSDCESEKKKRSEIREIPRQEVIQRLVVDWDRGKWEGIGTREIYFTPGL